MNSAAALAVAAPESLAGASRAGADAPVLDNRVQQITEMVNPKITAMTVHQPQLDSEYKSALVAAVAAEATASRLAAGAAAAAEGLAGLVFEIRLAQEHTWTLAQEIKSALDSAQFASNVASERARAAEAVMAEKERLAATQNARVKRVSEAAAIKAVKAAGAAEAVKLLLNGLRDLLRATEDEAKLLQNAAIEANWSSITTISPPASAATENMPSASSGGLCVAKAGRHCSLEVAEAEATPGAARRVQLLEHLVEKLSAENADQV